MPNLTTDLHVYHAFNILENVRLEDSSELTNAADSAIRTQ